ncbi:hypothetical protein PMAYCL1PPCAC_33501, partial [Pristionchus mayeri]
SLFSSSRAVQSAAALTQPCPLFSLTMATLILKVPPSAFSGAVNQVLRLGLRYRANCTIVSSAARFASTTGGGEEQGGETGIPLPTDTLDHLTHKEKKRLFRVARASRRNKTYDNDKIDKLSAMATYNLSEKDLEGLPTAPRPAKTYTTEASNRPIYALTDVYQRAIKKHGSIEAIATQRRPIVDMRKNLTDTERMRLRMRVEAANADVHAGADRVVGIAFTLNTCDMLFKFGAAYLTGSKSLFAEAIHSTMDTFNQLILLLGIRYSGKTPDGPVPLRLRQPAVRDLANLRLRNPWLRVWSLDVPRHLGSPSSDCARAADLRVLRSLHVALLPRNLCGLCLSGS